MDQYFVISSVRNDRVQGGPVGPIGSKTGTFRCILPLSDSHTVRDAGKALFFGKQYRIEAVKQEFKLQPCTTLWEYAQLRVARGDLVYGTDKCPRAQVCVM